MDTGSSEESAGEDQEGDALSVRELPACMEVLCGMDSRLGELLWVRVIGETSEGDIVVGGKYLESGEEEDKVLCEQFEEVQFKDPTSPLGTLITLTLMGRGNCRAQRVLDVSSGSWGQLLSTAARFANRGDAHLALVLAKREKWIRDVKSRVSLT